MVKHIKIKARFLLLVFLLDVVLNPIISLAGSGPSQPELAKFTPVSSSDLVDPFSGDFKYNIPLMDVEGYPVNISYNSGIKMNQDASWVGLGWNLNVGSVNRSVRGLPDDFKGDIVESQTSMKPMTITEVGLGGSIEIAGSEKLSRFLNNSTSLSFIYNNYKGFGFSFSNGIGTPSVGVGGVNASAGVGFTLNSLDGASINSSLNVSASKSLGTNGTLNFGGQLGTGYNTRTGQLTTSLGTTAGYDGSSEMKVDGVTSSYRFSINPLGGGVSFVPIGMNSYTPYPSMRISSRTSSFSASLGTEAWTLHPNGRINGSRTVQELVDEHNDLASYGYLYLDHASAQDLKDFNRDKSIQLNKTVQNLSPSTLTYDVFSVSADGVSEIYRPYRNDIGVISDPHIFYSSSSSKSYGGELGLGAYAHGGATYSSIDETSEYGAWVKYNGSNYLDYKSSELNSSYEPFYFKSGGDLSENNENYFRKTGSYEPVEFILEGKSLSSSVRDGNGNSLSGLSPEDINRKPRSRMFSFLNANDAQYAALYPIESTKGKFYNDSLESEVIDRVDESIRKKHHISEITHVGSNGERFVYGIPAYNLSKSEVTYTCSDQNPTSSLGKNRISHDSNESSIHNDAKLDGYYSNTYTPPYAHSFLLTSKQSFDYQDLTGNGVSNDDPGNSYKFSYTKTSDSYAWREPYIGNNFMEGFKSNTLDQKGSFVYGEKEVWYLHTIQSKNQVAEFYTSERKDGIASKGREGGRVPNSSLTENDQLHRLDSIYLYDKLDRLLNKEDATPLKVIRFDYDYHLCQGIPDQKEEGKGKLSLNKIEIIEGNDFSKSKIYSFDYSENPSYDFDAVDRWGNYKLGSSNPNSMKNSEFPYVLQENALLDEWAAAWNLTEIKIPSGGIMNITYESDDYGYVQDRSAMQMYPVIGAGNQKEFNENTLLNRQLYDNRYLYINAPEGVTNEIGDGELRKMLFGSNGKMKDMYFKFLTNINSKYDYVMGYTNAASIGFCPGDTANRIYIELENVEPNPISKIAWSFFRQNLFEVLYEQPTVRDTGLESILKGMKANLRDIANMFFGVENMLKNKKVANWFTHKSSFVRLQSWNKKKKGGGSRVKKIELNDNWNYLSKEGSSSSYGQIYEYSTEENGVEISSGVATYEPMVGNDENPFRRPITYTSSKTNGHVPAIEAYQEEPFGESLFPGASVGYSKVTVKNIHRNKGRTTNGVTEYNFFTAKDFPVLVKKSYLQKHDNVDNRPSFSFPYSNLTKHSLYAASQGFSIVLNDMHGKQASVKNYSIIETVNNGLTSISRKDLGGVIYKYHVNNNGLLDNEVSVLTSEGYIKDKLLGVESDIAVDSRRSYTSRTSKSSQINGDIIPGLFGIPFPLIVPGYNELRDRNESRTVVVTKVIQNYGLIESVTNYTDQYSTTISNKLYDGINGSVLLTEQVDEHKRNEFSFSIPSFRIKENRRIGGAYQNQSYRGFIEPSTGVCNSSGDTYDNFDGYLSHGDEVLIIPSSGTPMKAWVNIYDNPLNINNKCDSVQRLITSWHSIFKGVCAPIVIDSNTYLKGELGDIQKEVYIYPLVDSMKKKLLALDFTYNGDYGTNTIIESAHIKDLDLYDNGCFLIDNENYDIINDAFCDQFDSINGELSVFGKGTNLNYNLNDLNIGGVEEMFDLSDTIYGTLEYINSIKNFSHCDSTDFQYTKNYLSCFDSEKMYDVSNKYYDDYGIYNGTNGGSPPVPNSSALTALVSYPLGHYSQSWTDDNTRYFTGNSAWFTVDKYIRKGNFNGNCLISATENYFDNTIFKDYNKNAEGSILYELDFTTSKTSIRLRPKSSNLDRLDSTQLFLIEYKVKDNDNTFSQFYIEKGKLNYSPIRCRNDIYPYDFDKGYPYTYNGIDFTNLSPQERQSLCPKTYQLMDRNGNYISGLDEEDEIVVIRSAYNNNFTAIKEKIVTNKNPLNIDINGKFLGLLTDSSIINYYQSSSVQYKDSFQMYYPFDVNVNKILNATEGAFRVNENYKNINYRYSRTSNPEISKDGYLKSIPSIWNYDECIDFMYNLKPYSNNSNSAGWVKNETVDIYSREGLPLQTHNNLGIYNTHFFDQRGNLKLLGSNAKSNNIVVEDFEEYYSFGSNQSMVPYKFELVKTSGYNPTELLSSDSNKYYFQEFYQDYLVKGISHSGEYSIFLKGTGSTNTYDTIYYKEKALNPLAVIAASDFQSSKDRFIAIKVDSALTAFKEEFIEKQATETVNEINNSYTNSINSLVLPIDTTTINGLFKLDNGKYLISVWVNELSPSHIPFRAQGISIKIIDNQDTLFLEPKGEPIDGWQKIEGIFDYSQTESISIQFDGGLWGCFYDDFRIQPVNSQVNTYVYDRLSNRVITKLDENNYATFFDYSKDGNVSQIRKETDDGIITVSESRESISKLIK